MKSRTLLAALTLVAAIAVVFAATRRTDSVPAGRATGSLAAAAPLHPPQEPGAAPAFEIGPAGAAILVEEYSDFECPFCARSFLQAAAGIEAYIRGRGDVRYAFYDLAGPTHFQAVFASLAARCAGAQGRYPQAQRLLFERQRDWAGTAAERLDPIALVAPLVPDRDAYAACTDDPSAVSDILGANLERALGKGVQATPTVIVIAAGRSQVLRGTVDSARIAAALR